MAGQASKAKRGSGSLLKVESDVSPDVFVTIGDVVAVRADEPKFDEIDVTHLNSPTDAQGNMSKEWLLGVLDNGSMTLDVNFTGADNQDILIGAAGSVKDFRWEFPQLTDYNAAGMLITFSAYVGFLLPNPDAKGKISGSVRLRISGPYTFATLT